MNKTNPFFPIFLSIFLFVYIHTLDGTDTEAVYEEVIRQIAQTYDKPYPHEVRLKLLGTTEQRTAEIVVTDLSLPISSEEFLQKFNKLCRERLSDCPMKKG